jgi:hypothetical protein
MNHDFKYLISSGCSFTAGHLLGASGSWSTYLAEKLRTKLINLAIGGSGNDTIIQNVIKYATFNPEIAKDSLFVIQLSECLRYPLYFDDSILQINGGNNVHWYITPNQFLIYEGKTSKKSDRNFEHWNLEVGVNKWIYDNRNVLMPLYTNITYALSKTYEQIINFINFCDANNYKFLIFDGINNHIPILENDKYYLLGSDLNPTFEISVFNDQQLGDLNFFNHGLSNHFIHKKMIDLLSNEIRYHYSDPLCYFINIDPIYTEGNPGHPNQLASRIYADRLYEKLIKLNYDI